jgi:hypothetical protein
MPHFPTCPLDPNFRPQIPLRLEVPREYYLNHIENRNLRRVHFLTRAHQYRGLIENTHETRGDQQAQ